MVDSNSGTAVILCYGENPATSCPTGFVQFWSKLLPDQDAQSAGRFAVCVPLSTTRIVPSSRDSGWCGVAIRNRGSHYSFELDDSPENSPFVSCLGANPAIACPALYSRVALHTTAWSDDTQEDIVYTCVRRPNTAAPSTNLGGWFGLSAAAGTPVVSNTPAPILFQGSNPSAGCPRGAIQVHLTSSAWNPGSQVSASSTFSCVQNAGFVPSESMASHLVFRAMASITHVQSGTCVPFTLSTVRPPGSPIPGQAVFQIRPRLVNLFGGSFRRDSCSGAPTTSVTIAAGSYTTSFGVIVNTSTDTIVTLAANATSVNGTLTPARGQFALPVFSPPRVPMFCGGSCGLNGFDFVFSKVLAENAEDARLQFQTNCRFLQCLDEFPQTFDCSPTPNDFFFPSPPAPEELALFSLNQCTNGINPRQRFHTFARVFRQPAPEPIPAGFSLEGTWFTHPRIGFNFTFSGNVVTLVDPRFPQLTTISNFLLNLNNGAYSSTVINFPGGAGTFAQINVVNPNRFLYTLLRNHPPQGADSPIGQAYFLNR